MGLRHVDSILAVIPDMLFEMSPDGHYIDVHTPADAVYSPTTHGPPQGLVGLSIYDVVDKEGADIAVDAIQQALATGELAKAPWSRTFPDGVVRHYEARVVPTPQGSALVHIRDRTVDTDRSETLEALYDAMPLIVCHVDQNGRMLECHGQTRTPRDQIQGKMIEDLVPPELAKRVREIHRRALESDEIQTFRYMLEGAYYLGRARRTRINTVVYLVQDETDQIETLQELRRSNEHLQQFASVASHDLQEPLRGMHGPAQLLLEELGEELSEEHKKWLLHIQRNAVRAQAMVRDMLQFSRAGTQPVEPTVFDGLLAIEEVLEGFRVTIEERRAKIEIRDVPWLTYDRVKFQAVIGNLLSNAIKFHRPGVPPQVTITGQEKPDGVVVITVQDNGIGIPEEQIPRIFEPGRRLHHRNVYPGSGLGLASVMMIIDRCGGSIDVQSSVGNGTTFVLSLPGEQDRGHD
jgi:signal transduction histidine kinase